MSLDAASMASNLEQSLTAWLRTHLVTGEGLTLHLVDEPVDTRPSTWVDVAYLWGLRRDFGRQVGPTRLGARGHGLLSLNLCQQRQALPTLYALMALRDQVVPYVLPTQSIPVRDYATVGTPEVGRLLCMSVQEAAVDDGRESGVLVYNLSVALTYTEAFTLV